MTAYQRAKRYAIWRGSSKALLCVAVFCILLGVTDAIQQL
jgi:hypothetical protein